jgi:undecaprenyl-diphosphatase
VSPGQIAAAIGAVALAAAAFLARRRRRLTGERFLLELTTSLAVAGVGLYVFVSFTVTIVADHGATLLDDRVLDLADKLNTSFGVSVAKVVTTFGALPVTAAFVLAGAVLLAVRRRRGELTVLLLSTIAVYLAVHITKTATDRPRPPRPLASSTLSAFPSGHAAYSTVYVAMALIATRARNGIASRAALVIVAVLAAGAIGVSRAYLRVHWWSDVLAGWALGAAIFGSFAAVGVVVGYFRNNGGGEPAAAGAGGTARQQ